MKESPQENKVEPLWICSMSVTIYTYIGIHISYNYYKFLIIHNLRQSIAPLSSHNNKSAGRCFVYSYVYIVVNNLIVACTPCV